MKSGCIFYRLLGSNETDKTKVVMKADNNISIGIYGEATFFWKYNIFDNSQTSVNTKAFFFELGGFVHDNHLILNKKIKLQTCLQYL